jgi:putative tryptophan/tyrosine transport system substrate-binding protein
MSRAITWRLNTVGRRDNTIDCWHWRQRSAEGRFDRLPGFARELAGLPVDMFVVGGEASIRAAMQATDKIPITGMSALATELAGKRVELLKEIVPRAVHAAVLWNSRIQAKVTEWQDKSRRAA